MKDCVFYFAGNEEPMKDVEHENNVCRTLFCKIHVQDRLKKKSANR